MKLAKIHSEVSIVGLVFEIVLICFVFISITYFANKSDPFLINSPINVLLILVSVLTLFYGIVAGIIVCLFIGVGLGIFYKSFPTEYYLNIILFMLIFSEFHYFWNRIIKRNEHKLIYLENKFKEVTTAFYMLKLSHDQIEKAYVVKPRSLRNILADIKKLYSINTNEAYDELFSIITKNYGIRKSSLYIVENGNFKKIKELNSTQELNKSSRVFQDAIEKKVPTYLSNYSDIRSDYLAVIPGNDATDEIRLVLIIEDLPFFNYTKDNIFSIWIIMNYFADFLRNHHQTGNLTELHSECPQEVITEIERLSYLKNKIGLDSLIAIMWFSIDVVGINTIVKIIEENLRCIDIVCEKNERIFIIIPISSYENMKVVLEKITSSIKKKIGIRDEEIEIRIIEVQKSPQKTISIMKNFLKNR